MKILNRALNDSCRKKYGLTVVFFDSEKKIINFDILQEFRKKSAGPVDIYELYEDNAVCYGYLCGHANLLAIRFKNPFLYFLAVERFGGRFETFTTGMLGSEYYTFFFSEEVADIVKRRNSDRLGVDILLDDAAPVFGWFNSSNYSTILRRPIKEDNEIVHDFVAFFESLEKEFEFFDYECVKQFLNDRDHPLDDKENMVFANFLMRTSLSVSEAKHFFKQFPDYDGYKITRLLETTRKKIENGKLKPHTCKKLREALKIGHSVCKKCVRHESNKKSEKSKKKPEWVTIEDLFEDFVEERPKIEAGQYFDVDSQKLYYSWYNPKKDAFLVFSKDGISVGINDRDIKDWKKVDPKIARIDGAKIKPPKRVEKTIIRMLNEWNKKGFPKRKDLTLSRVFDRLYGLLGEYIYFSDKREYILLALWIIGTYMRQIFIWYPYVVLFGLRNVGKSTTLSFLSKTCFQGPGEVSADSTEAVMFRKASGLKGIMFVEHYEEIFENPVKDQIYRQYLENAWYRDSTVERINKETMDLDSFNASVPIAIGTREVNDVLDEKGIIIIMEEAPKDSHFAGNYRRMGMDEAFDELFIDLHLIGLKYAKKAYLAYVNLYDQHDKIYGRDWNKLSPLLALAALIDEERDSDDLFNQLYEYGVMYSRLRKQDSLELEDSVLQMIIREKLKEVRVQDIQERLRDEFGEEFTVQKISAIMQKLRGIIKNKKRIDGKTTYFIDMKLAFKRASQRGLEIEFEDAKIFPDDSEKNMDDFDEDDVNNDHELSNLAKKILRVVYDEMENNNGQCGLGTLIKRVVDDETLLDDVHREINNLKAKGYIEERIIGYIQIPDLMLAFLIDEGIILV